MSSITTLIIFVVFTITNSSVYYVNPSNNNEFGNGESWENAFISLSDAINAASKSWDEIWLIGDHIYYPSSIYRNDCFLTSRGVSIYGGFIGTENSISQRIFNSNTVSVISGDIGIINDNSDNCYHVIMYDRELTLNNVIISDGNANFDDDYSSQSNTLHKYGGALITADSTKYSKLTLYNVTFMNNQAINGGALWFAGSPITSIDVNMDQVKFINNKAIKGKYEGGYGGSLYLYFLAKTIITNTLFINNYARFRGGAVYIDYGGDFNCNQCIFDANIADGFGDGIFAEDRNSQTRGTFPVIENSVFINNDIIYFNGIIGTMIDNSFDSQSIVTLINSELSASSNVDSINIIQQNEIFWTDLDQDLVFEIDIELKELGDNDDIIDTDLVKWVDTMNVCYVKEDATNFGDGCSWNDAYNDLQDCIDSVHINGGEIWVKSGIYYPRDVPDWKQRVGKTGNMHKSFIMYENIRMYGGFDGSENKRDDRDWINNPTYLSCNLFGRIQCNEIMMAADGVLIDGFIFKDAGLDINGKRRRRDLLANSLDIDMILSSTSGNSGSGIYSNSTTISVVNSIFLQLFSTGKGGAVYCIGQQGEDSTNLKSPTFINVAFLGNRANMRGGAIAADVSCNFICKYCKFDGNSCAKKGGAVYLDFESIAIIENSKFNNNFALESGGCIAGDGKSLVTFNGNIQFIQNSAEWEGGCLYSGSGVAKNIIQGFKFEQTPIFNGNYMSNDVGMGQTDIYGWPFTVIHIPQINDAYIDDDDDNNNSDKNQYILYFGIAAFLSLICCVCMICIWLKFRKNNIYKHEMEINTKNQSNINIIKTAPNTSQNTSHAIIADDNTNHETK